MMQRVTLLFVVLGFLSPLPVSDAKLLDVSERLQLQDDAYAAHDNADNELDDIDEHSLHGNHEAEANKAISSSNLTVSDRTDAGALQPVGWADVEAPSPPLCQTWCNNHNGAWYYENGTAQKCAFLRCQGCQSYIDNCPCVGTSKWRWPLGTDCTEGYYYYYSLYYYYDYY